MQLETGFMKGVRQYSEYFLLNLQKVWLIELITKLGILKIYQNYF